MNQVKHWMTSLAKGLRFGRPQGNPSFDVANTFFDPEGKRHCRNCWVDPEGNRRCRTCLPFAGTPAPPRKRAPAPYRWWKHPPRGRVGTYTGRYDDPVRMDTEITAASKSGWNVKNVATVGSHINVGRTVTPAVLTGGLSLLLGASRTKEKYIVTFEYDGRVAKE